MESSVFDGVTVTDDTFIVVESITVMIHRPDFPLPSFAVAVITAMPGATAVTSPISAFTVATFVVSDDQATSLFSVLSGKMLELSVIFSFTSSLAAFGLIVTEVAFTSETVISHVSESVPHLAVIVAFPFAKAVTFPVVASTAAMAGLLEVKVTVLSSAFAGDTSVVRVTDFPITRLDVSGVTVMDVMGTDVSHTALNVTSDVPMV